MDNKALERVLLGVKGVSLLAIGWVVGVVTPTAHSPANATVTITQPGAPSPAASTVTITNTATQISTSTEINTQTVQASHTTPKTHGLVLHGVGTETLAPFTVHHSGELVWKCPSCGSDNFQVFDDSGSINVNGLDVTRGHTYVPAGHYTNVLVNTEGQSWTLNFTNG